LQFLTSDDRVLRLINDKVKAKIAADEQRVVAAKQKAEDEAAAHKKAMDEAAAKTKAEDEAAAKRKKTEEEAAAKKKAEEQAAAKQKPWQGNDDPTANVVTAADYLSSGGDPKVTELTQYELLKWYNLGASLDGGKTAQVGSQTYTKQQCYAQALTVFHNQARFSNPLHKNKHADLWNKLGNSLGVGETAQIGSQTYTKQQCYAQAACLNNKHAGAWNNLGNSLGVGETARVRSQTYTKRQCYVQALTSDPNYANAWINLGNSLGVGQTARVRSQTYTKQQCFEQALAYTHRPKRE